MKHAKKSDEGSPAEDIWDPQVEVEANAYNWNGDPVVTPRGLPEKAGPALVDLFSGAGGFSVGLGIAGFQPVLAVDIHKPSIDTYKRNHPSSATFLGDISRLDELGVKQLVGKREVSLITAGVPCQGFSLCNRKRWEGDKRNFLFREFRRIAGVFSPPYVLVENVSGLVSTSEGAFVRDIKAAIKEMGYQVEARMLNALEYGVPQRRDRIFFIGAKPGFPIAWPAPTHGPKRLPYRTVKDAIGDLPKLENGQVKTSYERQPMCEYQRLMRGSTDSLLNHEAPTHPQSTIDKIAATRPGEPMYPKYKQRIRLSWDQPSPTQVSGGIRPQFSYGHPDQPRGMSIRERCRIQSFPDHYYVCGGIVQGRVQTGNAVAPLMAQAIGDVLLAGINGKKPSREVLPCERRTDSARVDYQEY